MNPALENSKEWRDPFSGGDEFTERPRIRSRKSRKKIDWTATRGKAAYFFLVLFEIVYFLRPTDIVPGTSNVPVAKITGILAIGAFILSSTAGKKLQWSREMKLLVALFLQLCVATAFSTWIGGSFNIVVLGLSKVVILVLVLVECASTLGRLRQLLYLHSGLVAFIALLSLIRHDTIGDGRLTGAVNGIYGNPNDLAATVVCVMPFALLFMLTERNPIVKIAWGVALAWMGYCVVLTASRAGFMGMLVVLVAGLIYMGKSSRRLIGTALALGFLGAVAVGLQGGYGTRMKSITDPTLDETGSYDARHELLMRSIELAEEHPLLGVGPGQFEEYSGNWHVAHNSYTEFAAEAGLLAAVLFIWMMVHTMRKMRYIAVQKDADPVLRLYSGAMLSSLAGFALMIFFLSLEYQFVTYMYVGYGSALGTLYATSLARERAEQEETEADEPSDEESNSFPEEVEGEPYPWESS